MQHKFKSKCTALNSPSPNNNRFMLPVLLMQLHYTLLERTVVEVLPLFAK